MGCALNPERLRTELCSSHKATITPASARMGCALNPERLQTEMCSSHKATMTPASARIGCALNPERLRSELCSSHKANDSCQRSHGLRFEPGTAANRAVFKAQGYTDRNPYIPLHFYSSVRVVVCLYLLDSEKEVVYEGHLSGQVGYQGYSLKCRCQISLLKISRIFRKTNVRFVINALENLQLHVRNLKM